MWRVCSTRNIGLVEGLGADRIVDYRKEDFTSHRDRYDVIFDVVGNQSFNTCRRSLRRSGVYATTELSPGNFLWRVLTLTSKNQKARIVVVRPSGQDLSFLKSLFEERKLRVVLDEVYPLEEAAVAHAYGETGRAQGKIVLKVGE